jgi:RNA polymerase sigma factor (sigma-70 family)
MTQIQLLQKRVTRGVEKTEKDNKQDMALLRAYQSGNEEAGMELVENYLDIISEIYRHPFSPQRRGQRKKFVGQKPHIGAQDREDFLQEILLQFFVLVGEYDADTGKPFEAIIKGKLHHRAYHSYFSEFLDKHHNEDANENTFDDLIDEDTTEGLFVSELNEGVPADHLDLYQAMNKLGKRQREVFIMSFVNGWTGEEIAQELGISPNTVWVTKSKALAKMKELLAKEDE